MVPFFLPQLPERDLVNAAHGVQDGVDLLPLARAKVSSEKGYRTLAVSRGPESGPPALVGLVSLYDPPRSDARELIAALRDLGVGVKMLTGDALPVASEIARGLGLSNIRRVADLKAASAQPGNGTVDLFADADGFAEVFPEDKYVVVKGLQAAGHITGMTGDGVNDSPALRQAEVQCSGLSMFARPKRVLQTSMLREL